jgi:O-antigen/teichoic acid export membrane protein
MRTKRQARSRFDSSIGIALGLAFGQGLIFAATPLLSRLYDAEAFGYGQVFLSVSGILGAIACLRLELRIVGCLDGQLWWVVSRAFLFAVLTGVLGATGFWIYFDNPLSALFLAATVVFLSAVAVAAQLAARVQKYLGLASSKAVQGMGQVGGQASLARFDELGLQAGVMLGYGASAAVQLHSLREMLREAYRVRMVVSRDFRLEMYRGAGALTASAALNAVVVSYMPLVLTWVGTVQDVGVASLVHRLSVAPAGLIVAAITPVVLGKVGKLVRDSQNPWGLIKKYVWRLVPLSTTVFIVLCLVPQRLFDFALGPGWLDASTYALAFAPLTAGLILVGPFSQLLAIMNAVRYQFLWDVARFACLAVCVLTFSLIDVAPATLLVACNAVLLAAYFAYLLLVREACKSVGKNRAVISG